jgi:membrane protein
VATAPHLREALAFVRTHPRAVARDTRRGLADKRVVSHASAISYQLLFALVAFSLAAVAVLSLIGLDDAVWQHGVRTAVREHVSRDAFRLVDGTVKQIEGPRRNVWLTVGLALALWKLSVAARVTMDALDELYETGSRLPFLQRFRRSLGLALAAGTCLLGALVIVLAGGHAAGRLLPGPVSFVLRWSAAFVLLLAAAALILRYAPSRRQPAAWVSVGTLLVAVTWSFTSLAFGVYAAYIARWDTLFGGLTTVIAVLIYLYVAALAFLVAAQLDVEVRKAAGARGRAGGRGRARGASRSRRAGARDRAGAA